MIISINKKYILSELLQHSPFFLNSHYLSIYVQVIIEKDNKRTVQLLEEDKIQLQFEFFKLSSKEICLLQVIENDKHNTTDLLLYWLAIKTLLKKEFETILLQVNGEGLESLVMLEKEKSIVSIEHHQFVYIPLF